MSKTFINKFIFVFLVSMMVSPIQVQSCKYLMRGTMSLSSDWSLQSFFSLGTSKVQFHSNLLILSWGHKGWKDLIFWALIVVSDWLFQQTFPSLSNDYLTDHIEGLNCKLFQEIAKMYLQNMFVVDDSILDFSHYELTLIPFWVWEYNDMFRHGFRDRMQQKSETSNWYFAASEILLAAFRCRAGFLRQEIYWILRSWIDWKLGQRNQHIRPSLEDTLS